MDAPRLRRVAQFLRTRGFNVVYAFWSRYCSGAEWPCMGANAFADALPQMAETILTTLGPQLEKWDFQAG